ncbi:SUKH-3 domain-containing protein [Streptomyces sp. NPDC048516]|uniref:SUKH-3 domain-containing protein n=1 Tax=Streptomyces sp. NPDC048516 TaxID=3365565 RepID=UPI0037205A58
MAKNHHDSDRIGELRGKDPVTGEKATTLRHGDFKQPCRSCEHDGDFSEIAELSRELGKRLFRVGYDLPDGAIFVVAENGEFYSVHHTGTFYLDGSEFEFFDNWVKGDLQSV